MRRKAGGIRYAVATAALALVAAGALAQAQMPGGYGGAMGGMMGGGGMMGEGPGTMGNGERTPAAGAVDPAAARALAGYVQEQRLACMQCHAIEGGGFAPSFALIAQSNAGRPGAADVLRQSILRGIGGMPAGLASPDQAKVLSQRILDLAPVAK